MVTLLRLLRLLAPKYCRRLATITLCLSWGGCATTTAVPASGHAVRAVDAPESPFPHGQRQAFSAKTLPIDLLIPELSAFKVTETRSSLTLSHSASSTEIRVRFWSTSRRVNEAQCERELLLQDPEAGIRERDFSSLPAVTSQTFTPGLDYRGTLTSKVIGRSKEPISGFVHGIAAGLGHCLSFDAKTQLDSPSSAEKQMAYRLTILMAEIAASLRVRQVERLQGSPLSPFKNP